MPNSLFMATTISRESTESNPNPSPCSSYAENNEASSLISSTVTSSNSKLSIISSLIFT